MVRRRRKSFQAAWMSEREKKKGDNFPPHLHVKHLLIYRRVYSSRSSIGHENMDFVPPTMTGYDRLQGHHCPFFVMLRPRRRRPYRDLIHLSASRDPVGLANGTLLGLPKLPSPISSTGWTKACMKLHPKKRAFFTSGRKPW